MNSSPANRVQPQKSCGNAGSVERVENQTQVFHSSHRPLEISPTPRDFHIPTAQAGRAWKSGKPKSGFPLSHTRPATMTTILFKTSKSKPNLAASGGQRTNQKKESFTPQSVISVRPTSRLTSHWKRNPLSGSFRVGNKYRFQAHFRIGKCFHRRVLNRVLNPFLGKSASGSHGRDSAAMCKHAGFKTEPRP